MAGERTVPGIGLTAFWDLGSGYKSGMDTNLQTLSGLVQCRVISRTTSLPGVPSDGDIYIVPTGDVDAEDIAIRDNGAWVNITPVEGYTAYVVDEDRFVTFMGTNWIEAYMIYDIGFFAAGVMTDAELVGKFMAVRPFTLPASAPGAQADAETASTGTVSLSLQKNGVEFATCEFAAAATGTFTQASDADFAVGDSLTLVAPATADGTLESVAISLKAILKE
jgi:hypothetical protein